MGICFTKIENEQNCVCEKCNCDCECDDKCCCDSCCTCDCNCSLPHIEEKVIKECPFKESKCPWKPCDCKERLDVIELKIHQLAKRK